MDTPRGRTLTPQTIELLFAVSLITLARNPLIKKIFFEPPLATHFERGNLSALSEAVNRLLCDLQELCDLGNGQDFVLFRYDVHSPLPKKIRRF